VTTTKEAPTWLIWIPGIPKPQARPRARVVKGFASIYSPRGPWRKTVARELASDQRVLIEQLPVRVRLTFAIERPKSHYGTGRNAATVKPKFRVPPAGGTGDVDNFAKAVLDECNGVLFRDDVQVTTLLVTKHYARAGMTGVCITYGVDTHALEDAAAEPN
jgi:Holliday junction resolvase RusA-like endonuclease